MAIIPEPGQDRNPYEKDEVTHVKSWKYALSHMNRELQLDSDGISSGVR